VLATIDPASSGTKFDFHNTYAYDAASRVKTILQTGQSFGPGSGQNFNSVSAKRADFGYNARGEFDSITRSSSTNAAMPGSSSEIATSTFGYDPFARLTSLTHQRGATGSETTLDGFAWTFDALSRITSLTNSNYGESTPYTYDATGQLTAAAGNGDGPGESYINTLNGNRAMNGSTIQTIGAQNRLLSDGTNTYSYDAEGNRIEKRLTGTNTFEQYTWDQRNRLVQVVSKEGTTTVWRVVYGYDAFDRMVSRTVYMGGSATASDSQRFIYDGNQIVMTLNANDTVAARYLWGPAVDQVLAQENASGTLWALTDQIGTVHDWVDNSGSVVDHASWDSFGNRTNTVSSAAASTVFSYTGRYRDPLTGLQYNWHRWYDATVGQWLSEDPNPALS
jgi:RHS repeat-associated protein